MLRIVVGLLLAGTPASFAFAQSANTYVIRDVTVIDVEGGAASGARDVVISGRVIQQVATPGEANVPRRAIAIDGRGKYLIPGLIDAHVHIKEGDPLFLFVAAGVTTVQNMSGRPFHLAMRAQVSDGAVLGPRVITTGPTTAQAGVTTAEEVERLVLEQKAAGYNAIKMYGSSRGDMSVDAYRTLNDVARRNGLRVVGHAPRNLPFEVVLAERQASIDHMEEIIYTHRPFARLLQPYVDLQFGRAPAETRDSLMRVPVPDFARELRPEIAALAKSVHRAGLAVTPNLVFFRNIHWMTNDSIYALMRAPELAFAAPELRLNWSPLLNNYRNSWRGNLPVITPYLEAVVELQKAVTFAFHQAGVPIMAGTDSEYLGAQPGFGLHTELELFGGLGMKPLEALQAATITPARVLQIADSVGSIAAGKVADMVLLDADPLANVSNTRRIAGVFRAGQWLPRATLSAQLDSLTRTYAPMQAALSSFMDALESDGAAAALAVYHALPRRELIAKPVERVINSYGYRVLGEKRIKDAIAIFRMNTEAFPNEYNTWDSLAEAYLEDGNKELAIRYYQKVLELRPGDENATRMLKQLREWPSSASLSGHEHLAAVP